MSEQAYEEEEVANPYNARKPWQQQERKKAKEKEKIKVFGPKKIPSQLEGSKIFTKKICKKYNIPTANFGIFENIENAIKFLKSSNFPIVVKADGLASGKGVYICENSHTASKAVKEIFGGKFGEAKNILQKINIELFQYKKEAPIGASFLYCAYI